MFWIVLKAAIRIKMRIKRAGSIVKAKKLQVVLVNKHADI